MGESQVNNILIPHDISGNVTREKPVACCMCEKARSSRGVKEREGKEIKVKKVWKI